MPGALSFAGLALAAAAVAPLAPVISWVYGPNYHFSGLFVFLLLLAAAVSGATSLLGQSIIAWKGAGVWFLANLLLLGASVIALWLAPPTTAQQAVLIILLSQAVITIAAVLIIGGSRRDE